MARPGNILLITADQWRGDAVGAVGHPCVRTPVLDRLAAEGVLFRQHYTQAMPCGPARASLLTGLYLHTHRAVTNGTPLDARFTNIALEARRAGYDPTLFGYTDTTVDPRTVPPGDPRLTTYEGVLPGLTPALVLPEDARPWLAWLDGLGYPGPLTAAAMARPAPGGAMPADRGDSFAPARYRAEHSDTAFLATQVIQWLKVQPARPWFLHVSFLRPHPPWIAPAPYNALYHPDEVPPPRRPASPEQAAAQHPFRAVHIAQDQWSSFVPHGTGRAAAQTDRDVLQARATYYGLITEVDAQIGRILDVLRAGGQYDDTLIVVTSDHGEQLGDDFLFGKHSYGDAAAHIPLIVRDPDPAAAAGRGRQVAAFTEAVDVMPTVLDWLGLEVPAQCDGASLLPFLRGEAPAGWRDAAHWAHDFRDIQTMQFETALGLKPDQCSFTVLRDDRFKYVHFTALPPLLFDLRADPDQRRNLAGDPAHAATVLDYAQKMLSWRMAHDDRTLANMCATADGLIAWRGPRG